MTYPFSPEVLDAMPERMSELYRQLEITLLTEICERLKLRDNLNEVTIEDIRILRSHGISLEEIEKAIRETSQKGQDELNILFDDVVARNQQYYAELIDKALITSPPSLVSDRDVEAIRKQTTNEFVNLTQSMGFMTGSREKLVPPGQAYQTALDNAEMQILSGGVSYREAIRNAIKTLADSGLKTVPYDSGHVDQLDVAVRRAVMTGTAQISDKYTEAAAKEIGTELFEVSAHRGARDTGTGPANHKGWQGRVYSTRDDDPKYPSIYEVCGLGTGEGLEGWNCRHRRFPFVDGVSERTYTDEELESIDPPPFEFEGRTYTMYEATQKQRQIERTIRKLKREQAAYKAAGLAEDASDVGARIRRLEAKYRSFSKAAGLPEQRERMRVYRPSSMDNGRPV